MAINLKELASSNQAAVESLLAMAKIALSTAERVAALNLSTARNALDDGTTTTNTVFAAKDPQQALSAQSAMVQPAVEKAMAYTKSMMDISTESQEQITKMIESSFADYQEKVGELLAQVSKSAPTGSEQVIGAMKTAMEQADAAFANLSKMSKQFNEQAQANFAAAVSAVTGKPAK